MSTNCGPSEFISGDRVVRVHNTIEEVEIGGKRYEVTVANVKQQRRGPFMTLGAVVLQIDPKSGWEASKDAPEQVEVPVQEFTRTGGPARSGA